MLKRKIRTLIMPKILKNFWYVNEGRPQSDLIFNSADFVRFSQIDKILDEVKFLGGDVIELGVYRGRLSQLIADKIKNTDKRYILVDTFNGFKPTEVANDVEKGYISGKIEDFSNTSVDIVLDKIANVGLPLKRVELREGYFPNSLISSDSSRNFCFASVDFDLSLPTAEALEYLWPRMVKGGYIVVHDYGNNKYSGVSFAVYKFIKENN
ncbi:MAG: TylF/MycF family methyltransferase, partial [Lachnospiraceae bacterium]|nr:TylF/MycF family methyltransferase [Lachnospiraceae bacterium]